MAIKVVSWISYTVAALGLVLLAYLKGLSVGTRSGFQECREAFEAPSIADPVPLTIAGPPSIESSTFSVFMIDEDLCLKVTPINPKDKVLAYDTFVAGIRRRGSSWRAVASCPAGAIGSCTTVLSEPDSLTVVYSYNAAYVGSLKAMCPNRPGPVWNDL